MTAQQLFRNTFFRFLIVGGSMALFYAVLAALATAFLSVPKAASAAAAWMVCIPLGFWCQRRFTFATSTPHPRALWLYAGTQLIGICIGAGASYLFARGAIWPDLAIHLSAAVLAALISFLINRFLIFPVSPHL